MVASIVLVLLAMPTGVFAVVLDIDILDNILGTLSVDVHSLFHHHVDG